jgi:hypothetical protein
MSLCDGSRSGHRMLPNNSLNIQEVFMRKTFYYVALGTIIALAGCNKDAGSADVGPSSSISGGTGGEGAGPTGTSGGESDDNPAADNPAANGTGDNNK